MNIPAQWRRRQIVGLVGAAAVLPAFAQFRVEVTGVGVTQLPIAIAPFRGEAQSPQKMRPSSRPTWNAVANSARSMLPAPSWMKPAGPT